MVLLVLDGFGIMRRHIHILDFLSWKMNSLMVRPIRNLKVFYTLCLILISIISNAEPLKTVFNPFTGRPDYITAITTASISAGSGIVVSCTNGTCTISASGTAASNLQVTSSGVQITSPTASENFYSGDFFLSAAGGTTAQIFLNPSTTDFIWNTSSLQSGATFYVSSATVSGPLTISGQNNTITLSPGNFGGDTDKVLISTHSTPLIIAEGDTVNGFTTVGEFLTPFGLTNSVNGISKPALLVTGNLYDSQSFTTVGPATIQGTFPILSTSTLQSGSTFYVSSGTVNSQFISPLIIGTTIAFVNGPNVATNGNGNCGSIQPNGHMSLGDVLETGRCSDGQLAIWGATNILSLTADSGISMSGSGMGVQFNDSSIQTTAFAGYNSSNTWTGQQTFTSSVTITGAGGLGVTYNVTAGSMTLNNVASGTQCLHANSSGQITGTGSDCGSGGGGTPGGSATQIQYNNSGSFGGITGSAVSGNEIIIASMNVTTSGNNAGPIFFTSATLTDVTGSYPTNRMLIEVAPTASQDASSTSVTNRTTLQLRPDIPSTNLFNVGNVTGFDDYLTNSSTQQIAAMVAGSFWSDVKSTAIVNGAIIGGISIVTSEKSGTTSPYFITHKFDPSNGGTFFNQGTFQNFYGVDVAGMNSSSMTAVTRASVYIDTMPGTATNDFAGISVASQPWMLSGDLRLQNGAGAGGTPTANYVGLTAPSGLSASTVWTMPSADGSTTNQILQTNGNKTLLFSNTLSTLTVNGPVLVSSGSPTIQKGATIMGIQKDNFTANYITSLGGVTALYAPYILISSITVLPPSLAGANFISDTSMNLVGNVGTSNIMSYSGLSSLITILPGDNGNYTNANTNVHAGTYEMSYGGMWGMQAMEAINALDVITGTGTVTTDDVMDAQIQISTGVGTTSRASGFFVKRPTMTNGYTVSDTYAYYADTQTATAGTQTRVWGFYQAGTSDMNYFGGKTGIGTTPAQSSEFSVLGSTSNSYVLWVGTTSSSANYFMSVSTGGVTAIGPGNGTGTLNVSSNTTLSGNATFYQNGPVFLGAQTNVQVSTNSTYEQTWSTSTSTFNMMVSTSGLLVSNSASPTISSCGSTPNGSVVGDDNGGVITIGGTAPTACTLTFATVHTGCTMTCTVTDNSLTISGDISSLTTSALTLGFGVGGLAGGTVYYNCHGYGPTCR